MDGAETQDVLLAPGDVPHHDGADLVLFVGVDTSGSAVHRSFPQWGAALGLDGVVLRGVDLPTGTGRAAWRDLVAGMAGNPRVRGAVVTSHKLRLYDACRDLVDHADVEVDVMREINCLALRGGTLSAHARDVVALDAVLRSNPFVDRQPFPQVVCLGAGGAATALLLALRLDVAAMRRGEIRLRDGSSGPHLTFLDSDRGAASALTAVASRLGLTAAEVDVRCVPDEEERARVVARAAAGSIVVNATGLGKLGPGSPLPDGAPLPEGAVAWDFNYRGPLTFLSQARRAGATVVDGRDYYLAGWASALAAMTDALEPADALERVRATEQGRPATRPA